MASHSTTPFPILTLLAASTCALAFAALAGGCGQETGIVIEVDKGALQESPDELEFRIGVEADSVDLGMPPCGNNDDGLRRFVQTPALASDTVDVKGRDLSVSPYRLLLKPDATLLTQRNLMVVVLAYKDGDVMGVGALENPVAFVSGNVVQWSLSLTRNIPETIGDGSAFSPCDCASEFSGPTVVLAPSDDADCDGYVKDADCDDNDGAIYPDRIERCGNLIDDNCNGFVDADEPELCNGLDDNCNGLCDEDFDLDLDGYSTCGSLTDLCQGIVEPDYADCRDDDPSIHPDQFELCDGVDNNCSPDDDFFPQETLCYTDQLEGICRVGTRMCINDPNDPDVGLSACEPLLEDVYHAPEQSCIRAQECPESADSFECSNNKVYLPEQRFDCQVAILNPPGEPPSVCDGASMPIPDFFNLGDECVWHVLGAGFGIPYNVQLDTGFGLRYITQGCEVDVVISDFNGIPGFGDEVFLWMKHLDGQDLMHVRVKLYPNVVSQCPADEDLALLCQQSVQPGG